MKRVGMLSGAVLLPLVLCLANGCATVAVRSGMAGTKGSPRPYTAFRMDMFYATLGTAISWQALRDIHSGLGPLALFQVPACLADGAVSLATDTLLLPYDGYQQERARADEAFWDAFFAIGTPLPSVETMRQHASRHSDVRLARQVQCEGTELGTRMGHGRRRKPGTPAERAASLRLRSARHDQLIEAELVLAAVASRHDLTSAQVARLIPYAERRRDIRLALLGNPVTPADALNRWLEAPDPESLAVLSRNPGIPAAWAERLFAEGRPEILRRLAENPGLPRDLVEELADADHKEYWSLVVRRQDLPDGCVRRFAKLPWAGVKMAMVGRDDLPPDILRAILAAQPAHASPGRREVLAAMRRQRQAPADLLALAWQEGRLTAEDLPRIAHASPEVYDAIAERVADEPKFRLRAIEALIPRSSPVGLRRLRRRAEAERTSATAGKDGAAVARCQELRISIAARLKELRRN